MFYDGKYKMFLEGKYSTISTMFYPCSFMEHRYRCLPAVNAIVVAGFAGFLIRTKRFHFFEFDDP